MKGLANITCARLSAKFVGMLGADEAGREYRRKLVAQHVEPLLLEADNGAPSAVCLCLVTPDGQRTMRTCLGAACGLVTTAQLPASWVEGAALLHCEGYCLYHPQLARQAMAAARGARALVSLDLASFELVGACQGPLQELLQAGLVDVVFANEEEAVALAALVGAVPPPAPAGDSSAGGEAGHSSSVGIEAAMTWLLQYVRLAVVSRGAHGCVARAADGSCGSSPACGVKVVDTIGAGDCFTAGFLAAYLRGCRLSVCCRVGCLAGGEAVQTRGGDLGPEAWERLSAAAAAAMAEGGDAGTGVGTAEQARRLHASACAAASSDVLCSAPVGVCARP